MAACNEVLQKLIDLGVDEVFADYDEHGSIRTRAIAVLSDGKRKKLSSLNLKAAWLIWQ
jgi:hypothetical protein